MRFTLPAILTTCMLLLFSSGLYAQTWSEFFKQKKTQRKYLIKQITLLKTYASYVKKGVTLVRSGLTTVENIKKGDFNLHRDFFGSLNKINPAIRNSAKVADIIAFQFYINRNLREVTEYCFRNEHFKPEEVRYVTQVYTNLLYLSDASLSELLTIISSNELKMTDDERINRIDTIYDEVKDRQAFVKAFGNDVHYIAAERERQQHMIYNLNANYENL